MSEKWRTDLELTKNDELAFARIFDDEYAPRRIDILILQWPALRNFRLEVRGVYNDGLDSDCYRTIHFSRNEAIFLRDALTRMIDEQAARDGT